MKDACNCWPTPLQKNLLKASLHDASSALGAWRIWRQRMDLANLDSGSVKLLPLLYTNLKRVGVKDEEIAELQSYCMNTWIKNKSLFTALSEIIESLKTKNCNPLVLKGVPLIQIAYGGDSGLRPMDDADLLVKQSDLFIVEQVLKANGWEDFEGLPTLVQEAKHSTPFINSRGLCIDVHWRLLMEIPLNTINEEKIWSQAQEINLNGLSTLAPSMVNILLHVIVHGVRWSPIPPIRWCADAYLLITNNQDKLNWENFFQMAKANKLTLSVFKALHFLKNDLSCPIPEATLQQFKNHNETLFEKAEYYVKTNKFGGLFAQWFQYFRLHHTQPWCLHPVKFPLFLLHIWNIKSVMQLPIEIIKRVRGRLK